MEFVLLADNPQSIDKVAQWYFDEWVCKIPGKTLAGVIAKVSTCINRETAPMVVLAKKGGTVIGAAELKIREMEIYPDYEHWLGGVYVDERERGTGVASALVRDMLARAQSAGIRQLYLQTDSLTGGLYKQHGFEPLETINYEGHPVLVMVASLAT